MSDEHDIADVSLYLANAGLRVHRIPQANGRRCDLRAEDEREAYLIEVKSFHDDVNAVEAAFSGKHNSHVHRASVSREIRNAIKQLQGTAHECVDGLWLVALIARGCDPPFMVERIIGTIYGIAAINDRGPDGSTRRRRCLYFGDSVFHKQPELDGAIVLSDRGVMLCINDYGRRPDRVRQCGLACFLAQHSAIYDMQTWERNSDCLVADFKMDRADGQAVLARLKQKYPSLILQHMDWSRWGC